MLVELGVGVGVRVGWIGGTVRRVSGCRRRALSLGDCSRAGDFRLGFSVRC